MTFDEYQKRTKTTAIYPKVGHGVTYPALGLAGEAGEIANKVKKIFRDDEGQLTEEKRTSLKKELGDVLWYISQVSSELELSLSEIAEMNLDRLQSRKARGKLKGDGDNR